MRSEYAVAKKSAVEMLLVCWPQILYTVMKQIMYTEFKNSQMLGSRTSLLTLIWDIVVSKLNGRLCAIIQMKQFWKIFLPSMSTKVIVFLLDLLKRRSTTRTIMSIFKVNDIPLMFFKREHTLRHHCFLEENILIWVNWPYIYKYMYKVNIK